MLKLMFIKASISISIRIKVYIVYVISFLQNKWIKTDNNPK